MKIDINYSFTEDTPLFWETYWNDKMGKIGVDPDIKSKTLRAYHKAIWSKVLPNKDIMNLEYGINKDYLVWKDFRFGSDIMITSFRYKKYQHMIDEVMDSMEDYKSYMENYTRQAYTIGGMIIFPKMNGGINQSRGCNPYIIDRFDLTLECIRRYYQNEKSPLYDVLLKNKEFFDLFIDFRGYVDFFYLQDLVDNDYSKVKFWLEDDSVFSMYPFPKTVEEYMIWINKELDFVKKRSERILNDFK